MWRVGGQVLTEVVRVSGSLLESNFRELDDAFLQTQARIWLGEVLHIRFDEETAIADLLADGELLFQVSKVMWKKLAKKYVDMKNSKVFIHEKTCFGKSNAKYMHYPKVDSFLKLCQIIGLTGIDLFSPSDVVEKRNIRIVCLCIRSLSIKARAKELMVPDFDVVTYTVVMPTNLVDGICRYLEQSRPNSLSSSSRRPSREQYKKKSCSRNHDQSLEFDPEYDDEDDGFTEMETKNTTFVASSNANDCSYREELSQDVNNGTQADFLQESRNNCRNGHANADYRKGLLIQSVGLGSACICKSCLGNSSVVKENEFAYQQTFDRFQTRQRNSSSYWSADEGDPIHRDVSLDDSSQTGSSDSILDDFDQGEAKNPLKDSVGLRNKDATAGRASYMKRQECNEVSKPTSETNFNLTTTYNAMKAGICNIATEKNNVPVDLLVEVKETLSEKTHADNTSIYTMEREDMSESFTESTSSIFGADTLSEHYASSSEENYSDTTITPQINSLSPHHNDCDLNYSSEERTPGSALSSLLPSLCNSDHLVLQQILKGTIDHGVVSEVQPLDYRKCKVINRCATVYKRCSDDHCSCESTTEHINDEKIFPGGVSEIISSLTTRHIPLDEGMGIVNVKQLEVKGQVPHLSHNGINILSNKIISNTRDKNKETEKSEKRTIASSTSRGKDGELSTNNKNTKSGNIVLKSIAAGVTVIGAILLLVHLRKKEDKMHDSQMVVTTQAQTNFNQETILQNKEKSRTNDDIYPGKRTQL